MRCCSRRARRSEGNDVVFGYVEAHGCAETTALEEGFEILAPKLVERAGTAHSELDLRSALRRKPAVMLVDVLAHTNAHGSTHPKRYMNVLDLLMPVSMFTRQST